MVFTEYFKIPEATQYSGVGKRALRDALKDPVHPLPHYRLNRKTILIRRTDLEQWLQAYRVDPAEHAEDIDGLVNEVIEDLTK